MKNKTINTDKIVRTEAAQLMNSLSVKDPAICVALQRLAGSKTPRAEALALETLTYGLARMMAAVEQLKTFVLTHDLVAVDGAAVRAEIERRKAASEAAQ